MPSLKSTLRGVWWQAQLKRIRHCFVCGGPLTRRYVAAEGRRRLVCDDCSEINYTNPKVVAGMIPVMPDGRVVLLQRDIEPAKGKWSYPAGYQEMGESVSEAAVRETLEEVCTRTTVERLLDVYSYPDAGVVTVVYVGNVGAKERPAAGHESADVKLFAPEDIPWKLLAFRSTTDALKAWVASTKKRSRR